MIWRDHENLTPKCKNIVKGSCDFGVNCWFRHNKEKKNNKKYEIILIV